VLPKLHHDVQAPELTELLTDEQLPEEYDGGGKGDGGGMGGKSGTGIGELKLEKNWQRPSPHGSALAAGLCGLPRGSFKHRSTSRPHHEPVHVVLHAEPSVAPPNSSLPPRTVRLI